MEYTTRLNGVLKRLDDNNMEVVDIFVNGKSKFISNTYIRYKCRKCGSVSKPSSIASLTTRACRCPKQCHNLHWDYVSCYEVAKKCNNSTQFRNLYGGAYSAASTNGWLKDYTWFKRVISTVRKWNYRTTYDEARKYSSRYSFQQGSCGAYNVAKENKWLDDYTWLKKSYQDVQHSDIINKIYKRLESFPDLYFDETEFAHYTTGRSMKITLHCRKHPDIVIVRNLRNFLYGRIPNISYCNKCVAENQMKYNDFDEMIEELKKYKTLKEARQKDLCLIDHLCETEEGRKYVDMLERVNSAWKRGIYSYEFRLFDNKYVYVGLTCNFERRDKDHRKSVKSSVFNFAQKYRVEIPKMKHETEYIDWNLARDKESEYMDMYQANGYILINVRAGGGLGSINFKNMYTIEKAKEDIRKNKYKNINDISHRNSSLYNQILHHINNGDEEWKELLPIMTRKEPRYWTHERIKEIFLKFDTIADINKNGYSSAYRAYLRMYQNDEELSMLFSKKFKRNNDKRIRKVGMYDDSGNLIDEFRSIYEVKQDLIGFSTLLRALSNGLKARGYYWKYLT